MKLFNIKGLMIGLSLLLTACGEFQSINKNSNEVLESLSPFLTEEDQKLAADVSQVYNEPISIRENLIDGNTIEIEIEGHVAQLEVVNKNNIAFRLNGKEISFEELKRNDVLEDLVSSSLIRLNSKSASLQSLIGAKKSEAFLGSLLPTVFGLVIKGIFNYAVVKVTDKLGAEAGQAVGVIGDSLSGGTATKDDVKKAKETLKNTILNAILNRITGGLVQLPTNGQPTQPTNPTTGEQPKKCNLFCSLLGLLVNNLVK